MPGRIEALEAEQRRLAAAVAHPDFYLETAEKIRETMLRLDEIQNELLEAYALWDELDSRTP